MGFEFIQKFIPGPVYTTDPSWPTHLPIINRAGLEMYTLPYFNKEKNSFDFENFLAALDSL